MNISRSDSKKKSFRGIINSTPGKMPWPIEADSDTEGLDPLLASAVTISRKDAKEGACGRLVTAILNLLTVYAVPLIAVVVIALVVGVEKLMHDFCFRCPCFVLGTANSSVITVLTDTDPQDHNFTTGFAFLAIPPGILFMIGEFVWVFIFEIHLF